MFAGLIALAAVAAAPPPPVKPPPVIVAPPAARTATVLKALGMSDAGIAILRRQSAPDPDARALNARRQALRAKLGEAAAASPFDVNAFAALLRESATLEGAVRTRNEERIVTTLKALPAADRPIFAKAVFPPELPAPPAPPPRP
ncbi:MAG: periplasmic heavy metal sensor [Sphingomonas sp.]